AHYPAAFLCGLLNSLPMGFYAFHVLTSMYQNEGVLILPPHIDFSLWDHQVEEVEGQEAVRLGFRCIKGLHKAHIEDFLKKRKSGEQDFFRFDFQERSILAISGAYGEDQRREKYWKNL